MAGTTTISLEEARRIRASIVRVVTLANFVAAVVMLVLLGLLRADEAEELRTSVVSFVVVAALAFPAGAAIGMWMFRPLEQWVREDRPPTPHQEKLVLGGPSLVAALAFVFWVLAAVVIGTQEALDGGPLLEAVQEVGALTAAGVTSAALSFLLVERRARPLVAAALAGRTPSRSASLGLRPRLLLSWTLGSGVPLLAIIVGEVSISDADPRISPAVAAFLAGIGLLVGAVMTIIAVGSVAEPIDDVRDALATVERGDLSASIVVDDAGEVGQLQAGVNRMVAGLRERQQLADLFGRHVGSEVARQALEEGVGLGGERRQASALFVDLRDSTRLAAASPPEEVMALLNRFFAEVVRVVTAEGGWINKFEGDGALCVFGAPAHQADHASRALRAARRLHERLEAEDLLAAMGVSSGEVIAGNVGAQERYEYTVIGDPVNEAARLTEAAKQSDARVLASGAAIDAAGDEAAHWEPTGEVELRGRHRPTKIYRPATAHQAVEARG